MHVMEFESKKDLEYTHSDRRKPEADLLVKMTCLNAFLFVDLTVYEKKMHAMVVLCCTRAFFVRVTSRARRMHVYQECSDCFLKLMKKIG
jgi:hypothetical protein